MAIKKNLDDIIFEKLKNRVVNGEMTPGKKIDVDEVASHYEVSRTPVVQALKKMANDGMMIISRTGKYFIPEFDAAQISNICKVRYTLEKEAVDEIALYAETIDWTNLENITNRCYAETEQENVVESRNIDMLWHQELVKLADNECLLSIYRNVQGQYMIADYGKMRYALDMQMTAAKDHVAMLENLKKGEYDAVKAVLKDHIIGSGKRIIEKM